MSQVDDLMGEVNKTGSDADAQIGRHNRVSGALSAAQNQLESVEKEMSAIQGQINVQKQQIQDLIAEYNSAVNSDDEEEQKNANKIYSQIQSVSQQMKAKEAELAGKQREAEKLQNEISGYESYLEQSTKYLKGQVDILEDLQIEFRNLREKDLRARDQYTYLESIRFSRASAGSAAAHADTLANRCLDGMEECGKIKGKIFSVINKQNPGGTQRTRGNDRERGMER